MNWNILGSPLSLTQTQEAEFYEYCWAQEDIARKKEERNVDFEHVETLDWDMSTYLKMLDHNEVDYTRARPEDQFEKGLWYHITKVGHPFLNS